MGRRQASILPHFFLLIVLLLICGQLSDCFTILHGKGKSHPQSGRQFSFARSLPRQAASAAAAPPEWQGEVLQQLKQVIDPDLGADIVTLGFVQDLVYEEKGSIVSFTVELTTPACPVKEVFQADCQRLVEDLDWVQTARVTMTAQETTSSTATPGLDQIGAILAVASCKGGVGKSTTAVNLAFALQSLGATVGILDADVYGPSLPTMVTPDDEIVRFVGRQIAPLQRNGVRCMSFGFVNDGSAVMRGPMVTQVLEQLISVTHWGALDYLVVDMPPGTGDIPLTLTQRLNVTAAVIVSTPQELSFVDVVRGVEMFDTVQVPCVAVVENMGYYEPPANDAEALKQAIANVLTEQLGEADAKLSQALVDTITERTAVEPVPIFGPGHKKRLAELYGIEHTFSMPLLTNISASGDGGTPFVLKYPNSKAAGVYRDLASTVVQEVAKAKYSRQQTELVYDAEANVLALEGTFSFIDPVTLRGECRCASCVEELTGRQLLEKTLIPASIHPQKIYNTGNYAVSVDWSDGHRSLYPYRQVKALMQEKEQLSEELVEI